jgi:hypothetical protein
MLGVTMTERAAGDDGIVIPDLPALASYLREAGWAVADEDTRTSLWRPQAFSTDRQIEIVLPRRQEVEDYADRTWDALRVLAHVERRLPEEIAEDIISGGADIVAVRLTPDAPPGQAPLALAHSVVSALHSFVVASAAALEIHDLVLPSHRPPWAESYANRVRLSTRPGSFILSLTLPLAADVIDERTPEQLNTGVLFQMPPQPFGRRVTNRMLSSAQTAQRLAEDVSEGRLPLRAFGTEGQARTAANATELAAMKALGGPDYDMYQIRFAQSPVSGQHSAPVSLQITPGQQRILGEASEFLRTRQPRTGVTVQGLVVRLHRSRASGPGEVVVSGIDDDSGATRRYRVELAEADYNDAVRAHSNGLQVSVTGDREERGTHLHLRRLTSFSVMPGMDYDFEA